VAVLFGIGVMLVGFAEGLGAGKTYAARHHYEVDANRELLGLGAANPAPRRGGAAAAGRLPVGAGRGRGGPAPRDLSDGRP
jgi:hypothetical protein